METLIPAEGAAADCGCHHTASRGRSRIDLWNKPGRLVRPVRRSGVSDGDGLAPMGRRVLTRSCIGQQPSWGNSHSARPSRKNAV
jgi:hypothetical protein